MSPRYISKDGVWFPSKEKVALVNRSGKMRIVKGKRVMPNEPYIYEGPDRAALFYLYQEGVEKLGQDFHNDAELLHRIKQLGFENMEKYMEYIGYDAENVEAEFKKHAAIISKHELPKAVAAVNKLGGGQDTTGQGKDRYGNFGEPPDLK